jgi:hypothetical protein
MYYIPFDRSFLQLSNGIRHVMPSTDTKPELAAKASMAQPVSQPAVYANGLNAWKERLSEFLDKQQMSVKFFSPSAPAAFPPQEIHLVLTSIRG